MIVEVMLCMHESVNNLTTAESQKKGTSQPDHIVNVVYVHTFASLKDALSAVRKCTIVSPCNIVA